MEKFFFGLDCAALHKSNRFTRSATAATRLLPIERALKTDLVTISAAYQLQYSPILSYQLSLHINSKIKALIPVVEIEVCRNNKYDYSTHTQFRMHHAPSTSTNDSSQTIITQVQSLTLLLLFTYRLIS